MEKIKDLKIDKDFCNVLPNISNEEYTNLEKSILHNGFLNSNPIILWNGFIVDGHKRYEICRKHNIQYIYTELDINKFQTKMDVIQFIIEIHFGRRSLTKAQKISIVYKYKDELSKIGKERMRNGGKGISVNEKFDARKIISKMSGVSERTITQYDSVLKSGNRKLIDEMMSGEKSIYGAYKEITSRKSIPNKIQKIKILENNGSCEICGCDILPILEFHHINMVSNGGNNNCENIKLMCPNCHSLLHIFEGIKDESAKQTLIKNLKNTQYEKFSEMYS